MADTWKAGKRGKYKRISGKPRSKRQAFIRADRIRYGSTEKILRRNRRLWERKFAKEGRRLDKIAINESINDSEASK